MSQQRERRGERESEGQPRLHFLYAFSRALKKLERRRNERPAALFFPGSEETEAYHNAVRHAVALAVPGARYEQECEGQKKKRSAAVAFFFFLFEEHHVAPSTGATLLLCGANDTRQGNTTCIVFAVANRRGEEKTSFLVSFGGKHTSSTHAAKQTATDVLSLKP